MKKLYLLRHGETAWTLSGQHTGTTDIDLTPHGENQARALGRALQGLPLKLILCSPLKRATHTCALAHCLDRAALDDDLKEWNYGDYEGKTTKEIWEQNPGWEIFTDGAPRGENKAQVQKRAERILRQVEAVDGDVALFSHGHFLRVLTACWLRLPPEQGRLFALSPGSLSVLSYERQTRVILLWNTQAV